MKIKLLVALGAAVHLSACASIVSGSTQDIAFNSASGTPQTCTATGGSRFSLNERFTTPAVVNVKRSKKDIEIACDSGATKTVPGEYNAWTLGGIPFGGLIAVGIDAATGAIHKYPSEVVVDNATMATSSTATAEETVMP